MNKVKIGVTCRICDTPHIIEAPAEALQKYKDGAKIQHALPMLTPDERELLLSGTCPTCWNNMFGGE